MTLSTTRNANNTRDEHIADHNTLHAQHNELIGHAAKQANVHGITDVTQLIVEGDSRLTDARTPTDGSVTNAKVAADAAIALSKLATDPLARANHTGTQAISTVSGLQAALDAKSDLTASGVTLIWDGSDFAPSSLKASTAHKTFIGPSSVDPSVHSGVTLYDDDVWIKRP